jgi:RND family efflux transporter MFP subunit
MSMESSTTDLSALRIRRGGDPAAPSPRKTLIRWLVIGGVVLAAAVTITLWVLSVLAPAVDVRLVSAAWTSPSQSNAVLNASGYVVAQRKASVASKATGRLMALYVVEGDKVKKDQVIARLEDSDIRAQLEQARANLRLNEADLNDAKQSLARQKMLLERNLTSQAEYDAAEARFHRVEAAIDVARSLVTGAEVALENTVIRAPFSGTVLSKSADVGEMVVPMAASVGSRAAVVTIADMTSLQAEMDVSESNIERITLGQDCEITLDAYPDKRYQGYVAKIVPTADRAKATVMVKVAFRAYDARVLPEMSAKVLFLTKASDPASLETKPFLTVLSSAVAQRGGRAVVYRILNNKAVEVPVTIGRTVGNYTEIVSGLTPGEKVIEKATDAVTDGVRVKVQ